MIAEIWKWNLNQIRKSVNDFANENTEDQEEEDQEEARPKKIVKGIEVEQFKNFLWDFIVRLDDYPVEVAKIGQSGVDKVEKRKRKGGRSLIISLRHISDFIIFSFTQVSISL
jgi:hypothetical protein